MMETNRKHLLDKFQELLGENFRGWCEKHGEPRTDERLVTFLIDQDLIPTTQIQRYAVQREFDQLRKDPSFQKTHSVSTLATRYEISERTVWNILKYGDIGNGKQH